MQVWTLTQVRPTANVEFVSSRHFPDEAQGNFLVTNTIGFQGIKQYTVREEGSGFVAVETEPLLMSTDPNFRPIAIKFGFDGALYIADWFNPLIGHMQYSLRDPRRDTTHGRIWRITAKGRPLNERPKIDGQPIEAQLELLKAYEDRTRYQARLALRARPTDTVVAALKKWIDGLESGGPGLRAPPARSALGLRASRRGRAGAAQHAAAGQGVPGPRGGDPGAAALVRSRRRRAEPAEADGQRSGAAGAPRSRARAQLRADRRQQRRRSRSRRSQHPVDYYLQYTLDSTITTLEKAWKPALTSGQPFAADNPEGLTFLLARLDAKELIALPKNPTVLRAIVERPGIDADARRARSTASPSANNTAPAQELIGAIERLDGEPGARPVVQDLTQILADARCRRRSPRVRSDIVTLATLGKNDVTRQGAFAALLRADAGSQSRLGDRLGVAAQPHGSAARRRRAEGRRSCSKSSTPKILASLGDGGRHTAPAMQGRFVRVVLPGAERSAATRRSERHERRRERRASRQGHAVEHRRGRRHRRTARTRHRQQDRRRSQGCDDRLHGARTGSVVGDRPRRVASDRVGRHLEPAAGQRSRRRAARHRARLVAAAGVSRRSSRGARARSSAS